jgi:tetratricopeptide (TPR) repeat protein
MRPSTRSATSLIRDAAYAQIPRRQRAERHRLAAEWIETLGRPDEHAELLAHHYQAALEFARASGEEVSGLSDRARSALRAAGDRARSLTAAAAAARFYEAALELTDDTDPGRPRLLLDLGEALHLSGRDPAPTLEAAVPALLLAGDTDGAATGEVILVERTWQHGQRDAAYEHLDRAVDLIRDSPPSPAKSLVLSEVSRYHMLGGRFEGAVATGLEALSMAEELGLDEVRADALNNIGSARSSTSDADAGIDDLRRSIDIAMSAGAFTEALRGYNNLGATLIGNGEYREAVAALVPGLELAERYRGVPNGEWLRGHYMTMAFADGRWDELQSRGEQFLAEQGPSHYNAAYLRELWARVRLARGDIGGALREAETALEFSRQAKDPQRIQPSLASMAFVLLAAGRLEECSRMADELLALDPTSAPVAHVIGPALDLAVTLAALGRGDEYAEVAGRVEQPTRWVEAGLAFVRGQVEEAADICERIGVRPCEAYVRMLAGEQLMADGRREAAEAQLSKAIAFYRSVSAGAYLSRAEILLAGPEAREGGGRSG